MPALAPLESPPEAGTGLAEEVRAGSAVFALELVAAAESVLEALEVTLDVGVELEVEFGLSRVCTPFATKKPLPCAQQALLPLP